MVNARNKGKRGELEFAKWLTRRFGLDEKNALHRTPNSGGLDFKGDILTTKPPFNRFHFEIKRCETVTIWKWLAQVEADARQGRLCVLAFRRNNSGWYITMPADDWATIVCEKLAADERIAELEAELENPDNPKELANERYE